MRKGKCSRGGKVVGIAFEKGHEKLGGRRKGTSNKVTESIKALLNTLLPEDELAESVRVLRSGGRCCIPSAAMAYWIVIRA